MSIEATLARVQTLAKETGAFGNTIKFDLGDDKIVIDGTGDENVVSTEDTEVECTIKVSEENLLKLIDGNLNAMAAYMTGKIKIDGNMGVAMKLTNLF